MQKCGIAVGDVEREINHLREMVDLMRFYARKMTRNDGKVTDFCRKVTEKLQKVNDFVQKITKKHKE